MNLSEEHASQGKVKLHSVAVLQSAVFQRPVIDPGIWHVISQTLCRYGLRFWSSQLIITVRRLHILLTV